MKRILIVENDPDVIELIGGQLGREEFAQDVYKPKDTRHLASGKSSSEFQGRTPVQLPGLEQYTQFDGDATARVSMGQHPCDFD